MRQRRFQDRVKAAVGTSYKDARRKGLLPVGLRRTYGVTRPAPIKVQSWQGSQKAHRIFWTNPYGWTVEGFARAVYARTDPAALGGAAKALQALRRRLE